MIKKLLSVVFFLATWSVSQDLKIIHMEGSYDLGGDGLKEFATVESDPDSTVANSFRPSPPRS